MKQLAMLTAGLSLCLAAPALSAQRPIKAIKLPTQCATAACYGTRLDAATASLEATIAEIKLKGKFDPDATASTTFDSAHDFWLKEMNLTCKAVESFYEGGTLAAIEPLRCKVEMMEGRTQLLRSLYRTVLKN